MGLGERARVVASMVTSADPWLYSVPADVSCSHSRVWEGIPGGGFEAEIRTPGTPCSGPSASMRLETPAHTRLSEVHAKMLATGSNPARWRDGGVSLFLSGVR